MRFGWTAAVLAAGLSCGGLAQDAPPPVEQPQAKSVDQMSVPELLSVAQQLRKAGQVAQAQTLVKVGLAREDKNLEAHLLMGELCLELTPPDAMQARTEFMAARRLQGTEFRANMGLAKLSAAIKMWRQTLAYLKSAESTVPPERVAEYSTLMAEAHRNTGAMPEAFKSVEAAIKAEPRSIAARQMNVALLIDVGQLDKALIENSATIDLAREQATTATNKLDALQNLYRVYGARLAILQKQGGLLHIRLPDGKTSDRPIPGKEAEIAEITKKTIEVRLILAEMGLTFSYFETIAFAERAVLLTPGDVEAWTILARLYRNTSQFEKAVRAYQKIVELDPANVEARREMEVLGPSIPTSMPAVPDSQPTTQAAAIP